MSRRGTLIAILYGLTLFAVFTIAVSSLVELDFWWDLAAGERIVAARAVSATDPFSYTAPGRPWINPAWASQVLVFALWQAGGRVVLIVVKALIVAATFGVVLLTMRRRDVHPIVGSGTILVAAWAGRQFWDVRPQIVTCLLLAVFLLLLREGWERRPRSLVWLAVLIVPWANLDAGFVTGIAVLGLVGVGTALPALVRQDRRGEGWRVLRLTIGAGVATLCGSLVNPYGIRAILLPFEVMNARLSMSSTTEWLSPNFHDPAYRGLEVMLLLLVPAFAWGHARLRLTDVLIGLTFAHLALSSARHVPLFAVAVAPLLADGLQAALREVWDRRPRAGEGAVERLRRQIPSLWPVLTSARTPVAVAVVGVSIGLLVAWVAFLDPGASPFLQGLSERRYPQRTMTFIEHEHLPAPIFNADAWGGYELWRLYPEYRLFMDRRTHVSGREVLQDFLEVTTLGPRWRAVLDKWEIQTVLAQPHSPLTQVLLAVGGWRLVFAEREAAVFVRESDTNQALLGRLEPVTPSSPPREVLAALAGGLAAAEAGDDDRAIRHYEEILALVPDHPVALMSLGILQEKRGRRAEARALFGRIVELYRDGDLVEEARRRLERLE